MSANFAVQIGICLALLGTAALLATAARFVAWRNRIQSRLRQESFVISTSRGLVEYADFGDGTPVLVLHGTPGGYDQPLAMLKANDGAGKTMRFIVPSRPGYLQTPITSGRTPSAQAQLCAALLDALNIDHVVVIGASGGGPAALQFAALFPRRCAGLILEAAVTQSIAVQKMPIPAIVADLLVYMFRNRAVAAARASAPDDPALAVIARRTLEALVPIGRRIVGLENDRIEFAQLDAGLPGQINCPTLILHGTADTDVPLAHAHHAHAMIAGSKLALIKNADHNMFAVERERLGQEIEQFVAAVGRSRWPA